MSRRVTVLSAIGVVFGAWASAAQERLNARLTEAKAKPKTAASGLDRYDATQAQRRAFVGSRRLP